VGYDAPDGCPPDLDEWGLSNAILQYGSHPSHLLDRPSVSRLLALPGQTRPTPDPGPGPPLTCRKLVDDPGLLPPGNGQRHAAISTRRAYPPVRSRYPHCSHACISTAAVRRRNAARLESMNIGGGPVQLPSVGSVGRGADGGRLHGSASRTSRRLAPNSPAPR